MEYDTREIEITGKAWTEPLGAEASRQTLTPPQLGSLRSAQGVEPQATNEAGRWGRGYTVDGVPKPRARRENFKVFLLGRHGCGLTQRFVSGTTLQHKGTHIHPHRCSNRGIDVNGLRSTAPTVCSILERAESGDNLLVKLGKALHERLLAVGGKGELLRGDLVDGVAHVRLDAVPGDLIVGGRVFDGLLREFVEVNNVLHHED
eukprot:scaffold26440_cov30-Tisochrysis_lutea.AAC.1